MTVTLAKKSGPFWQNYFALWSQKQTIFLNKGLSGCSAFIVETPIDGNEPVCLHDQGVQVARDEQEESNQVARAED